MKKRRFKFDTGQLAFSLRKKVPWTNRPLVLGLVFLAFLFFGRAALRVYDNKEESVKAASEAATELSQLESRKQFLTESLDRLSTPEGREAELRRRFGVARPDENVAIIIESDSDPVSTSTKSFWDKIKELFKVVNY